MDTFQESMMDAIRKLDALPGDEQEIEHGKAENILLTFLRQNMAGDLAMAFERANKRVGFWYA